MIALCLILFAYHVHPIHKLIVAANRDEFYERPTASAYYWDDYPEILAGRDLMGMGTWMGVNTSGQFSALTNYRNPSEINAGKRSRGELVGNFLKEQQNPKKYLENVAKNKNTYPGFNLIVGDVNHLFYYSNIENKVTELSPGIYGLSNHLLNTEWPKVKRGMEGLEKLVKDDCQDIDESLFTLLQNAESAHDKDLPKTGVPLELERTLSSMFIKSPGYGTRSSTVLKMNDKTIHFKERVYGKLGIQKGEFSIEVK